MNHKRDKRKQKLEFFIGLICQWVSSLRGALLSNLLSREKHLCDVAISKGVLFKKK